MTDPPRSGTGSVARWLAGALLLIGIVMPLLVGIYARSGPELFGFPFYYWYQFLWIVIGAGLTAAAYCLLSAAKRHGRRRPDRRPGDGRR
jgi:Protein of unknown function (DUF3311)